MVTLQTQIPQLLFSSQFPDLAFATSDDSEAAVSLHAGNTEIFQATHIPYGRVINVHDLRSVIEYYMRQHNLTLEAFQLRVTHIQTTAVAASFKVVYLEQHFTGDTAEFLRNNFLTTMAGKLMSPKTTEYLHFFSEAFAQEVIKYRVVARVYDDEPRTFQKTVQPSVGTSDAIRTITVTHDVMVDAVTSNGWNAEAVTVLACSVQVGARVFTYYVQDCEPNLTLYFRNAFNRFECCALNAVTTQKPKVERSIAVTNRVSSFYNQQNEKQYEVETAGLTMEQARWIEQLFYSHDVRMDIGETANPQLMPIVLINDTTCEVSDEDGELNSVKFTYQYQDRRTWLQTDYLSVDHERVFTEEFDPSFQ